MNLADIGNAIGGVVSGGLTGLIGIGVQRVFEYKSKQLDVQIQAQQQAHEVAMKEADAKIMAQEWAARTQVAQIQATAQVDAEDAKGFSAALTSEPQRYADATKLNSAQEWIMVFLDFVRGMVRPTLTLYLCVLTTLIYFQARQLIGSTQGLTVEQAVGLVTYIVNTVLYLTVTAVTFWFGTRNKERAPKLK